MENEPADYGYGIMAENAGYVMRIR